MYKRQALQGAVPGLFVSNGGNAPGTSKSFQIRGAYSLGVKNSDGTYGNTIKPLVLIDNVEGDIDMINPEDIESINVLKDAASAAIYGARAAGGVILVTTKKGQGGKTLVSYNSNFTFENVMIQPEFQNEYGQGTDGAFVATSRNSWGPKMGTVVTDWTGQTRPLEAKNNDFSDFMNTGTSWTNSVDVTGSAAKMNYRVGLSNTTCLLYTSPSPRD